MKVPVVIIIYLFIQVSCQGQNNKWFRGNDSAVKANIHYLNYCKNLVSSKVVDRKKMKLDDKIIRLANQLFNEVSSIDELKTIIATFKIKRYKLEDRDTATIIEFRPYSNGNIRLSYRGVFKNKKLDSQYFSIGTESKVNCREPLSAWIQYFDVIYIKDYFLEKINFPFLIQPFTPDYYVRK